MRERLAALACAAVLASAVAARPARAGGALADGLVIGAAVSGALTAVVLAAILIEGSREERDPFLRLRAEAASRRWSAPGAVRWADCPRVAGMVTVCW